VKIPGTLWEVAPGWAWLVVRYAHAVRGSEVMRTFYGPGAAARAEAWIHGIVHQGRR
jgi:hypothetical protein